MMKNKVTAYDIPTFDCRSMAIAGGTDVTTVLHKFIIFFCITGIYIYKTMVLFLTLLIIFHIFFFVCSSLSISAQILCHLMMFVQIDENLNINTKTLQNCYFML